LTLPLEKQRLLEAAGVSRVETLPFTAELARLEPVEFVRDVLRTRWRMDELVLGHDHGFGRGRSGDVDTVRRIAASDGFAVDVVDPVKDDGQPISSTLIRTALAHGDLALARRWLGRPYGGLGTVQRGAGRGRTIGIPTLNLPVPDARKLLPPDGVYAVRVTLPDGAQRGGMMNQGSRPTFGVQERGLEIHLFDFDAELYGATVWVEWVRRLRDVRAFPSRDALIAQLAEDRVAARQSLTGEGIA
jgi:riboflavin kinase / FMN adenylyltransferase